MPVRAPQAEVTVDFLGDPVRLPVTPYLSAILAGVPLILCFAPRVGRKTYEIEMFEIYDGAPVPRGEREAKCRELAEGYASYLEKMCRRYPRTLVVIDHFARIGIDGTIRESDLRSLCGLARHANVRVKVSAFYALGKKRAPYLDLAPMVRRLLDAFGSERLMWASDCPFQVQGPHAYEASVNLVRERLDFLTDDDRDWLLRRTAERVFFQ